MRAYCIAALSVSLAGCAGKMIDEGMSGMVGQPLAAAVAKIGLPTSEQVIAGQKVYVWYTGSVVEGSTRQCRIRAIMRGEIIGSFDYEGNNGACMRYAAQLQN